MKKITSYINKTINEYKFYYAPVIILLLIFSSCKKQLDVKDPNDPTFDVNVTDEAGITAYAQGGVYWNGFN